MDISSGVNVVGYHRLALGLGSEARRLTQYLRTQGIDVSTIDAPHSDSQVLAGTPVSDNQWRYPNTVSVVTAQALPRVMNTLGEKRFKATRHAGMWYWELEQIPVSIKSAFELVDEVWAGSQFIGRSMQKHSPKPVYVFPIQIPSPPNDLMSRAGMLLPTNKLLFLCTFDFFSVFERKNPIACIRAFRNAFGDNEDVLLIIKSQNANHFSSETKTLRDAMRGAKNIIWRDAFVSDDEQWSLIAAADCLVSTHRSEGLGLHLLQAIACRTHVICTGYSAPAEFVHEPQGQLIDYTLTKVPAGIEAYPEGSTWAEPDANHLAALLTDFAAARQD